MKGRSLAFLTIVAGIGFGFGVPLAVNQNSVFSGISQFPSVPPLRSPQPYFPSSEHLKPNISLQKPMVAVLTPEREAKLRDRARAITVKLLVTESRLPESKNWGSGIIVHRSQDTYTVVTNHHVLSFGDIYKVQTPDGHIYQASQIGKTLFPNQDLALVQFRTSNASYQVATLGDSSSSNQGDLVTVAGFPFHQPPPTENGFLFTVGQISGILEKVLQQGYKIGYTNSLAKGMSGGPVLNLAGEVVAIHGKGAHPVWGDPYVYQDGTRPKPKLKEMMVRSNWGIPVQTFRQQAPQFTSQTSQKQVTARFPHFLPE